MNDIFKVLKENENLQSRILHPGEIVPSKNEDKIKTFSGKQKLENLSPAVVHLQEILRKFFKWKENNTR